MREKAESLIEETAVEVMTLREKAQGLVEYGLIVALIALVAIAGLIFLGPVISSQLSNVGASIATP